MNNTTKDNEHDEREPVNVIMAEWLAAALLGALFGILLMFGG